MDELSATDAWAVGASGDGGAGQGNIDDRPLIEHWNGTAWSVVPAPCLAGTAVSACSGNSINLNELTGVTALSGNNAWASGSEGNVNDMNFHIPHVLHWNGTAWSLVKTPNRGGEGSLLNGITALGADDIWAVGQTQSLNGAIKPLTEQFNGSTWSLVASPATGSTSRLPDDSLAGVASPGGGMVVAAGARNIPGQCCLRTLGLKTTSG